jgi:hypothetical protein
MLVPRSAWRHVGAWPARSHRRTVLRSTPIVRAIAFSDKPCPVLLYRKMAEAVLNESRSKHYSYAAKDVLSAGQSAEAVTDWKGHSVGREADMTWAGRVS